MKAIQWIAPRRLSASVALALCLASSSGHAIAAGEAGRGSAYIFAFENAEVGQVAAEVFGTLSVPYVVDPSVTGRMTFRIQDRLTRAQLLQAFEAALNANGVSIVRDGGTLVLTTRSKAKAC